MTRSTLLLAAALASVPLAAASARPSRPKPAPTLIIAPGGDARLRQLTTARTAAILTCALRPPSHAPIQVTLRASFDHAGRARQVIVNSDAGRRFELCVATALRGRRSAVRGASGPREVTFAIEPAHERPGSPPAPAPVPAYQACKADSDCTIYFRSHGCFPGDPMAVNQDQLDAARKAHPATHLACAMGGPQYEMQRRANEGRYTATCKLERCEVVDRGARASKMDPLFGL